MQTETAVTIGKLSVPVREKYMLSPKAVEAYEGVIRTLMSRYPKWRKLTSLHSHGTCRYGECFPSRLISVEFMGQNPTAESIYDISCDSRGAGIAQILGVSVASTLGDHLNSTGTRWLGAYLSPQRQAECPDFMSAIEAVRETGAEVEIVTSLGDMPSDCASWICSTPSELEEDLQRSKGQQVRAALERSIFWPYEYGNRSFLLSCDGIRLSDVKDATEINLLFPRGFIVRRLTDPEDKIMRYPPEPRHEHDHDWYKQRADLDKMLGTLSAQNFIACSLQDLHCGGKRTREHRRLFFIQANDRYQLIGGYATCVRTGKVEIGPHATLKPIFAFRQ